MKLIFIDGIWYDVTEFVKTHPGGSVINHYIGQDASTVYKEMHRRSKKSKIILKKLPIVERNTNPSDKTEMLDDFALWRRTLEERGFFKTSASHTSYRMIELFSMFLLGTWLMSMQYKILAVIIYGVFGARCGWVQHEAGHKSLTGNANTDMTIQKVVMGLGLLLSGPMWNNMHNKHHASTQKLEYDIDLDTMPFVLFHEDAAILNKQYSKWWLRYQAYTYLPITSGMLVTSFWIFYLHPRKILRDKDHVQGILTLSGHVFRTWLISKASGDSLLISYMYLLASMYISGVYLFGHFSLSHTFTPVVGCDETPTWIEYSLNHTVDIDTQNPIICWIMGYLNCQCVHHLFPQMPQYRQCEVSKELEVFASKWGLTYKQVGYFEAWNLMFKNLNKVGKVMSAI